MPHETSKCPNCGRVITDDEIYCYFCDMNISRLKKMMETCHHTPKKTAAAKNKK